MYEIRVLDVTYFKNRYGTVILLEQALITSGLQRLNADQG